MTEPTAAAEGRQPTSPPAAHLADPRALQILIAPILTILVGAATFVVSFAAITAMDCRSFAATGRELNVRFPHLPLG